MLALLVHCWYKSTNTDGRGGAGPSGALRELARVWWRQLHVRGVFAGTQFTCFTGTKVQILTRLAVATSRAAREP